MATPTSHNKKSSAVKRILSEARELEADSSREYEARPLESDIFEWHFTVRGPMGTEFEKGIYHGRILLPAEYPMRPPNLMLLTPSGRWECHKKICLTFTGFHEEMWQPAWGIRTALLGVQAFMSAKAEAANGVGALDYPESERRKLADKSRDWRCDVCEKTCIEMLPDGDAEEQQSRKQEALPDGLEVDPAGGSKKDAIDEVEASRSSPAKEESSQSTEKSALAPQASTTEAQPLQTSKASPQQSSSGASAIAVVPASSSVAKEPVTLTQNEAGSSSNSSSVRQRLTTTSSGSSQIRAPEVGPRTSSQPVGSSSQASNPSVRAATLPTATIAAGPAAAAAAAPPPPPRTPSRSELRVAQLDRAIVTVVLLLCGLVVRRLL